MAVTLLFAALAGTATGQTKKDHYKELTAQHEKAKEHADAIANGSSATKEDKLKDVKEARKNLEDAMKTNELLKKEIAKNKRATAKVNTDVIQKHHSNALDQLLLLKKELKKTGPDDQKVKEHARNLSREIEEAEKEQQALKRMLDY